MAEAREQIQAGADRQEVMAKVFASFDIDIETLKAKCAEAREARQKTFGEKSEGRLFGGPKFGFHGRGGFRSGGFHASPPSGQ